MLFLDVIATPFYLLFGVGFFILMLCIAALVVLTMIIFAAIERKSAKKSEMNTNEKDSQH